MQVKIPRHLTDTIRKRLQNNPVVAILGPRQCGKTTLADQIVKEATPSVYLDLENPEIWRNSMIPLPFSAFTAAI